LEQRQKEKTAPSSIIVKSGKYRRFRSCSPV